jgi:4-hydroxy-2-oxoheptanedioate aldolase
MKNLRERLAKQETLVGCFLNLGSSLTTELMGRSGFDWLLIDLEHGAGSESDILHQLQALEATSAAAVIRVEGHERQRFHRVLDLGAHGIMVPRVENVDDARKVVAAMRYQPTGVRGVAQMNRACNFGTGFANYFASANTSLLTVLQIESQESLSNLDAIAGTDGCDVLFIGPTDLSQSLGIIGQFEHPTYIEAVKATALAAQRHGKAAGILARNPVDSRRYLELGFRFIACNSDGGLLNAAALDLAASMKSALSTSPTSRGQ